MKTNKILPSINHGIFFVFNILLNFYIFNTILGYNNYSIIVETFVFIKYYLVNIISVLFSGFYRFLLLTLTPYNFTLFFSHDFNYTNNSILLVIIYIINFFTKYTLLTLIKINSILLFLLTPIISSNIFFMCFSYYTVTLIIMYSIINFSSVLFNFFNKLNSSNPSLISIMYIIFYKL